MNADILKVGLVIEVLLRKPTENGVEEYWQETKIERVSDSFVWFKGMGLQRVGKTTFLKYPQFHRVK